MGRPPSSFFQRVARAGQQLVDSVASGWGYLISPFEQLIGGLFRRFMSAVESLERVEVLAAALLRWLFWPVRWLYRSVSGTTRPPANLSRPIRNSGLVVAYRRSINRIGQAISWTLEHFNLDIVVRWVVWLLWPLWRPISGLIGAGYAWIVTREPRKILYCLPALVVCVPFLVITYLAWTTGAQKTIGHYRLALDEAANSDDVARTQLIERKLSQLGASTQRDNYYRALAVAADGDLPRAYQQFQQLAPTDSPGYPPAHFWILDQILSNRLPIEAAERGKLIDQHIEQLTTAGIESIQLELLRASRLVETQQLEQAIEALRPLAEKVPAAAFELVRIEIALGKIDDARRNAPLVMMHASDIAARGDRLSSAIYEVWANSLKLTGRDEQLERVCQLWLAEHPQDVNAQKVMSSILTRRIEARLATQSTSPLAIAQMISEAAELGASPEWLAQQIERLYQSRDNAIIESELPEQTIETLASNPELPTSLAETLGVVAAQHEEWERSKACFATMAKQSPANPVAWNNLAWVCLQSTPAEIARARSAVERAVQLDPDNYQFRATRGQVLARQQEWQLAIVDLELALNVLPENSSIRQALAEAYEATGQSELAEIHRNEAD
jgi:tetratricopeptide (TPR) repeat protein